MLQRSTDSIKIQSFVGETLRSDSTPPETIVENFLWKEDAVMLLGSEKSGKSILAQQMMVSIVSGQAFINGNEIRKQGPVVYIQAEGKRDEFVDRLNHMLQGIEGFDDTQFLHLYKKYCPLNQLAYFAVTMQKIHEQSKVWGQPPVAICIDSVYKAMDGDLNDNRDVIGFTNAVDELISQFHSAILLIHHDSKEWRDEKHDVVDRGDKGSYGSVFLRAYVDHILYLKKHTNQERSLVCETTRSSKTAPDKIDLILVEPSPLLFQKKGDYKASVETIVHQLKINGEMSYKQLQSNTGLAITTLKEGMSQLLKLRNNPYKVKFREEKKERFFSLESNVLLTV